MKKYVKLYLFLRTGLKARVWVDFKFYKMMKDLMSFQTVWCYNDAICSIVDDSLFFSCLL